MNTRQVLLMLCASVVIPFQAQPAHLEMLTCRDGSCGSQLGPGLLSYPGSGVSYTTIAEARATDYATLGARAQVSGTKLTGGIEVLGVASAVDRIFIAGTPSGTIDFFFSVDGSTSVALDAGYADLVFSSGPVAITNPYDPSHDVRLLWREHADGTVIPLISNFTVSIGFAGFFDTRFYLASRVVCEASVHSPTCIGSADVNFLNTLHLNQIIVRDGSGNVVDNPILTSQSGFDYSRLLAEPGAEVPEPSTFALLSAGILTLGLLRCPR